MALITIDSAKLINIIDTLGSAQTRCAALAMCSAALDKDHRDAIDFLARDADHVINLAIDAMEELRSEEGKTNG